MTKVADVMHSGIDHLDESAQVADIARLMRERDIGAVPIKADGRLVGIVTDRDIALRSFGDGRMPDILSAADIMSKPIICCEPAQTIEEAVQIMGDYQIRRLPVVDGDRMVGMLSLGDIAHCSRRALASQVASAVTGHHA